MLDFIKKSCFNKTSQYKKLFIMYLVDTWIDKLAPTLGAMAFFILLTKRNIPEKTFFILIAAIVVQFVLMFIVHSRLYIYNFKTVSESIRDFQIVLGKKLRRLPMGFYQSKNTSDLLKIIVDDHNTVNMTWTGIIHIVSSLIINIFLLVLLIPLLDFRLGLIFISLIPLSYVFLSVAKKKYVKVSGNLRETMAESSDNLLDYISGLSTLRLFNMRGEEFSKLTASLKKLKQLALKMELSAFPVATFSTSILFMGTGIVAYFGAVFIEQGSLNPVLYIVFLFVAMQIYTPLVILYLNALILTDFKAAVKRIYGFYDYDELQNGSEKIVSEGNLLFKNLNFSYGAEPVLKNINLDIRENNIYAVVGESGCGKTTLLKMLLRYYEPDKGAIFLNQKSINSFDVEKYLSLYGVAFQNAYMFNKSVSYNIGIAKNDASFDEIMTAAKMANCHQFIEKLENGYETVIGVNGSNLSAGQRQRIAVARAFLKDARIILMDEPTASLDIENEMLLKMALQKLAEHKTVIVVSHRLNFIKDADEIIVMDEGEINGIGTHGSLIENNAVYQNLWANEKKVLAWNL